MTAPMTRLDAAAFVVSDLADMCSALRELMQDLVADADNTPLMLAVDALAAQAGCLADRTAASLGRMRSLDDDAWRYTLAQREALSVLEGPRK